MDIKIKIMLATHSSEIPLGSLYLSVLDKDLY